jgi:hypothetical protein
VLQGQGINGAKSIDDVMGFGVNLGYQQPLVTMKGCKLF